MHDDKASDKRNKVESKSVIQTNSVYQASEQNSNHKSNEAIINLSNSKQEINGIKLSENTDAKLQPKSQLNILPELKEVQSFGSVDLIPVTNQSKPELKVHEKPVNNFVEITPLVNKPNENALSQSDKLCELDQLNEHANGPQISGLINVFLCKS